MSDQRYKPIPFTAADVLEGAYRRAGTMPTADAAALYDRVAAARAAGQHRLVANLSQQYASALAREHARRNAPAAAAPSPTLSPRPHLDEVDRLRAGGKTRLVASYEENFAGPLAIERQARTAEIEAWKQAQAAAEPPPTIPTETRPPLKPRKHLDELAHLRATGQTRAAATLEHSHAAALAHEARQRAAEQRGEPEPLSLFEAMSVPTPHGWPATGGDK